MTLKEILGDNYKEDMSVSEIDDIISKMKLADLSTGEYVAKGKLTEAEKTLKALSKEYGEYKAARQTEEEKKAEEQSAELARIQAIEEENRLLKAKEQLIDNGFSKDEITYLMENEQSSAAFASIIEKRVQNASKQALAKDIKNNTEPPAAGNGDISGEPHSLREAMAEKYNL